MTLALRRAAVVLMMLSAAACQGSYSSGPQIPNTIPSGAPAPAANATSNPAASTQSAASAAQSKSFAFSDAARGFTCPQSNGFGCVLKLNVPPETPAPSASPKTTAPPSPSPAPSASSSPSPAASPSPTPSAGPLFTMTMSALPKDAPKMVITNKDTPPTTAVVMITLVPSADFPLDGRAIAEFTLPKDQLANRGFAIQLFEETVKHKRHDIHPLYTLSKSTLVKQTLTFSMTPPKLTLPKGRKYFVILYGDQQVATSASPTGSASPAATASPAASASPSASPKASATP